MKKDLFQEHFSRLGVVVKQSTMKRLHRNLYNAVQLVRAIAGRSPIDNYCDESAPGEIFQCGQCGYLRPWSRGAWDDMEEACDYCWAKHDRNGETVES